MEGAILSSWDHIMGPQIEKLWFLKENSVISVPDKVLQDFNMSKNCKTLNIDQTFDLSLMKTYTGMCGQLLLGEVDSCKKLDEWSSRLYISENKILLAVLFQVDFWKCSNSIKNSKNVCLCFGIVFKSEKYPLILYNHLLIDKFVRKTVNSIKSNQFPLGSCLKDITALVEDVSNLLSLINQFQYISKTTPGSFSVCSNWLLVQQAIVSHLQTSGCSAVIGSSQFMINEIIYFLSSFTTQRSMKFQKYSYQFSKSYIIGLCIQNTTEDVAKSRKFLLERATKDLCPLTVIDLTEANVWQTIPFQENSKSDKKNMCLVTEIGSFVPELLNDLAFLEKNGSKDCNNCIKEFCLMLNTKCCALIKTIEYSRCLGKLFTKKAVMTMLAIQNLADLEILLGYAENLKPGIRNYIMKE